jgi:acetate kinase
VDLIVFTGGIGENDGKVRTAICDGLSWAGVSLDDTPQRAADNSAGAAALRRSVMVLPSQEDEQIARHGWALTQRDVSR